MPWVLLQQLVTATGLWLNISTQKGPLTVIKTNVFALLLQGSNTRHTRTHTGAVTPNLDTEREGRKKIKGRQKARGWEGLALYIPHKRPLPPSTCYHRGCSERKKKKKKKPTYIDLPPLLLSFFICLFYPNIHAHHLIDNRTPWRKKVEVW